MKRPEDPSSSFVDPSYLSSNAFTNYGFASEGSLENTNDIFERTFFPLYEELERNYQASKYPVAFFSAIMYIQNALSSFFFSSTKLWPNRNPLAYISDFGLLSIPSKFMNYIGIIPSVITAACFLFIMTVFISYDYTKRYHKWALKAIRYVTSYLIPIFIIPLSTLYGESIRFHIETEEVSLITLVFFGLFIVFWLTIIYIDTTFRTASIYMENTVLMQFMNNSFGLLLISKCIFIIIMISAVEYQVWVKYLISILYLAFIFSIFFRELIYFPYCRITIGALVISHVITEPITIILSITESVNKYVRIFIPLSMLFIVYFVTFPILRIVSRKEKIKNDIGTESKAKRALRLQFVGDAENFATFDLFKKLSPMYLDTSFQLMLAKFIVLFPTESKRLSEYVTAISRNSKLKIYEEFSYYQIKRVHYQRQSWSTRQSSIDFNRTHDMVASLGATMISMFKDFADRNFEFSVNHIFFLSDWSVRTHALCLEMTNKYPHNPVFHDLHAMYLLDCCSDFFEGTKARRFSVLISNGREKTQDLVFSKMLSNFPAFTRAMKERTKRTPYDVSAISSASSTKTDTVIEDREKILKNITEVKYRLSFQNAVSEIKNHTINGYFVGMVFMCVLMLVILIFIYCVFNYVMSQLELTNLFSYRMMNIQYDIDKTFLAEVKRLCFKKEFFPDWIIEPNETFKDIDNRNFKTMQDFLVVLEMVSKHPHLLNLTELITGKFPVIIGIDIDSHHTEMRYAYVIPLLLSSTQGQYETSLTRTEYGTLAQYLLNYQIAADNHQHFSEQSTQKHIYIINNVAKPAITIICIVSPIIFLVILLISFYLEYQVYRKFKRYIGYLSSVPIYEIREMTRPFALSENDMKDASIKIGQSRKEVIFLFALGCFIALAYSLIIGGQIGFGITYVSELCRLSVITSNIFDRQSIAVRLTNDVFITYFQFSVVFKWWMEESISNTNKSLISAEQKLFQGYYSILDTFPELGKYHFNLNTTNQFNREQPYSNYSLDQTIQIYGKLCTDLINKMLTYNKTDDIIEIMKNDTNMKHVIDVTQSEFFQLLEFQPDIIQGEWRSVYNQFSRGNNVFLIGSIFASICIIWGIINCKVLCDRAFRFFIGLIRRLPPRYAASNFNLITKLILSEHSLKAVKASPGYSIISLTHYPIIVLSNTGEVEYINNYGSKVLNITIDQAVGNHISSISPLLLQEKNQYLVELYNPEGKQFLFDVEKREIDGKIALFMHDQTHYQEILSKIQMIEKKKNKIMESMMPKSAKGLLYQKDLAFEVPFAPIIVIQALNVYEAVPSLTPDYTMRWIQVINDVVKRSCDKFDDVEFVSRCGSNFFFTVGIFNVKNESAKNYVLTAYKFVADCFKNASEAMDITDYSVSFRCSITCGGPYLVGLRKAPFTRLVLLTDDLERASIMCDLSAKDMLCVDPKTLEILRSSVNVNPSPIGDFFISGGTTYLYHILPNG